MPIGMFRLGMGPIPKKIVTINTELTDDGMLDGISVQVSGIMAKISDNGNIGIQINQNNPQVRVQDNLTVKVEACP